MFPLDLSMVEEEEVRFFDLRKMVNSRLQPGYFFEKSF